MTARILIVDDHEMFRDGLRLRLQAEPDMEVVGEAGTAAEAELAIARESPDVVLMDVKLPDGSGIDTTRRIHAARPGIRVIVLTSLFDSRIANDALLAGASAFLRKEDSSDELVRAIRIVLDGKIHLSPDAATAVAATLRQPSKAEPALSDRELKVLQRVAEGLSYKEIASEMNLSVKTVETYRARLARKVGCSTRAELVRYAIRTGLVQA